MAHFMGFLELYSLKRPSAIPWALIFLFLELPHVILDVHEGKCQISDGFALSLD